MSSEKQMNEVVVTMPEGVKQSLQGGVLTVQGPLGKVSKDFSKVYVLLESRDGSVVIRPYGVRRRYLAALNTVRSHVRNMVEGVTEGYTYRLKVVYAHFPTSVKVKGNTVLIENFYGERSPRVADIVGACKVSAEGDDVLIKGVSKEDVGQTSANIEQATRVKRKDQRVFLDGVYVYERTKGQ
ncbi:MAG: 50S ribosomal protein L6 [Thaumarchaeota archaeon]|nr:50S ribosomal protein L6 [Nitrososphaerota archaeon]